MKVNYDSLHAQVDFKNLEVGESFLFQDPYDFENEILFLKITKDTAFNFDKKTVDEFSMECKIKPVKTEIVGKV